MPDKSILEQIKHYQRDIIKCPDDAKRMMRCIERLTVLPVTIAHLQETGVGRSVNDLRKCGGEVGAAANALVCKWKSMVKDEEEEKISPPGSDDEKHKEYEPTTSDNHRSKSPQRNEPLQKHKQVANSENGRKSVSSHSSSRKSESSHSESKSSKSSDQKHSSKSDHRTHRDKSSKPEYSSSSDSKYSSAHRSKRDFDSNSYKKTHSNRESESECNGSVKSDKLDSKPKSDQRKSSKSSSVPSSSENKNKDLKQKYDKEKHRKEDSSHKHSSSKKYDIKRLASDSSDDEIVYKPSSRKRKKTDSDEEKVHKSESKKLYSRESSRKETYDSSEETDVKSESEESNGNNYDNERSSETPDDSESEERSNKSDVQDDICHNEPNSNDDGSSAEESEDDEESQSEVDYDSDNNDDSPERIEYIPTKIKREKVSPPRYSKSHSSEKGKSSHDRSSHSSSSYSKSQKTSSAPVKREKCEEVKVKKEKTEKETENAQRRKEDKSSSDKKHHKSASSHSESSKKRSDQSDKKSKVKIEKEEDGSIDCESGASFGDALLGLSEKKKKSVKRKPGTPTMDKSPKPTEKGSSKSSSKTVVKLEPHSSSSKLPYNEPNLLSKDVKLEPLDVDLNATLPEISPNYKPLPHYSPPGSPASKKPKLLSQEEALSTIMSTKNQRTKVYSGNKTGFTKVPSLFDLCIQILRENIDALEYTGGVPYDLLKPVLDRATADQLYQLEHYNPYLIEDTDGQWQFHCSKEFRGKKPDEFETWRELYLRCLDEREKKLQALKANITQSMAKSNPIRQTKLAYVDSVVKPPRNIAKKQMKYGTNKAVKHDLVSKAMVGAASSTPAPKAVPVPAPPARPAPSNPAAVQNLFKKKKAPLMAKALQLIKGNRFKR